MKTGWFDIDAMVDSAPAGMLERWRLYYEKTPFGEEWLQVSVILSNVVNELRQIRYAIKGEEMPKSEWLKENRFVPKFRSRSSEGKKQKTRPPLKLSQPQDLISYARSKGRV